MLYNVKVKRVQGTADCIGCEECKDGLCYGIGTVCFNVDLLSGKVDGHKIYVDTAELLPHAVLVEKYKELQKELRELQVKNEIIV